MMQSHVVTIADGRAVTGRGKTEQSARVSALRAALKALFPGVRFRFGRAGVPLIEWVDGPESRVVQELCKSCEAGYFSLNRRVSVARTEMGREAVGTALGLSPCPYWFVSNAVAWCGETLFGWQIRAQEGESVPAPTFEEVASWLSSDTPSDREFALLVLGAAAAV